MREYLHNVRYSFVESLAEELKLEPAQLLVDCILADGVDAIVVVDNGSAYTSYDQTLPIGIEHRLLPASTRERLLVPARRAVAMTQSLFSVVDTEAEWEAQVMQASWRTCEVSVAGKYRKKMLQRLLVNIRLKRRQFSTRP